MKILYISQELYNSFYKNTECVSEWWPNFCISIFVFKLMFFIVNIKQTKSKQLDLLLYSDR